VDKFFLVTEILRIFILIYFFVESGEGCFFIAQRWKEWIAVPTNDIRKSVSTFRWFCFPAPTQSPSYAESQPQAQGSGSLPLSMDPVLAVVSNATGHQVKIL
jgi:hypothetical protein